MKSIILLITIFTISCSTNKNLNVGIYTNLSNEKLINELITIKDFGPGYEPHSQIFQYFILDKPKNGQLKFLFGKENEIIKEIVSRGVSILPSLVKNINNPTKTNLEYNILQSGIGGISFCNEYEPKDPKKIKNYSPDNEIYAKNGKHILTIGDFCFFAIGQIVNRDYLPIRGQPTGFTIINSPVQNKTIANKVIDDWSNISRQDHINHLLNDLKYLDKDRKRVTLKRLNYFYPEVKID